jgi:hypothetical protein
MEMVPIQGL